MDWLSDYAINRKKVIFNHLQKIKTVVIDLVYLNTERLIIASCYFPVNRGNKRARQGKVITLRSRPHLLSCLHA